MLLENDPHALNSEKISNKQGKPTLPLGEITNKVILNPIEPTTPTGASDPVDANQEAMSFKEVANMAEEQFEQEALKEHVVEYESHFPELGASTKKAAEPETEFTPELLEEEVVTANVIPDVEPVFTIP